MKSEGWRRVAQVLVPPLALAVYVCVVVKVGQFLQSWFCLSESDAVALTIGGSLSVPLACLIIGSIISWVGDGFHEDKIRTQRRERVAGGLSDAE